MGKIDKEKLLKLFKDKGYLEGLGFIRDIKNFPEEPAIDFDALYEEHQIKNCDVGNYCKDNPCDMCYNDFLKSKNLTQPHVDMDALRNDIYTSIQKPREIPVKTIYTLKKEYQDVFKDFGFLHSTFDTHSYEPPPENIKKYYDRTDEVDYSAIPKGSVVEVRIKGVGNHFCKFHSINDADGSINLHCVGESDCTFKLNKDDFIRVVEWDDNA